MQADGQNVAAEEVKVEKFALDLKRTKKPLAKKISLFNDDNDVDESGQEESEL